MKIVVLKGSPNTNGSSNLLAEHFIRGAEESGHSVRATDAAPTYKSPDSVRSRGFC